MERKWKQILHLFLFKGTITAKASLILFLGLLPVFFVAGNFINKSSLISQNEEKFSEALALFESEHQKRASNTFILSKYKENIPFYIDQNIENNKISFVEKAIQKDSSCQESLISLSCPVEVTAGDIQQLLVNVEDVTIGNIKPLEKIPHLIITEFSLHKKNDAFVLNMEMLQRIYRRNA
jgi:hypothetical protein